MHGMPILRQRQRRARGPIPTNSHQVVALALTNIPPPANAQPQQQPTNAAASQGAAHQLQQAGLADGELEDEMTEVFASERWQALRNCARNMASDCMLASLQLPMHARCAVIHLAEVECSPASIDA